MMTTTRRSLQLLLPAAGAVWMIMMMMNRPLVLVTTAFVLLPSTHQQQTTITRSTASIVDYSSIRIHRSSTCTASTTTTTLYASKVVPDQPVLPTDNSNSKSRQNNNMLQDFTKTIAAVTLSSLLLWLPGTAPPTAHASNYNALSNEQKVVAEAWRLVDNSYLDRTFNHQDWFQLRQDYVNKKKYKTMDEAHDNIATMVSTLGDKYTRYLSPAQYQSLVDSATGTLAGVGIEISLNKDNNKIYASDVQDNSPALAAGIQMEDVFVSVDGTTFTSTSTPDDVAVLLRGPPNSRVSVTMDRNGKQFDYIITRQPITIQSVKSYLATNTGFGGKVGVIKIKSFSGTTAQKVSEAWNGLKKQGANYLVFDLRGNPGGLLPGGVDTASLFLDVNVPVVFVVNKSGVVDAQKTLNTGTDLDTPMVVLVDGNTASAAEVFTAAMKENNRATIVGEQTFGKGIVQTIRELSGKNGGVAITVARYETPTHQDINKQGIAVQETATCPKNDAAPCLKASYFKKPTSN